MNLEAIEKRCEAATPGPWTWEETEAEKAGKDWGDIGKTLNAPKGRNVLNAFGYDASYVNVSDADAEFIAHARSDIPALIAEVKRLNAELIDYQHMSKVADGQAKQNVRLRKMIDAPTADVEPVVRGEWILLGKNEHDYETSVEEKCSLCGRYVYRYDTELQDNYCPNCGAHMDGEGD